MSRPVGGRKLEIEKHFIFDVDGTLTPSRGEIDHDFAVFFSTFCAENNVYLVTGSDRDKTLEQVGDEIYSLCKRVYNCSGCDVWEGSTNIRASHWILPEDPSETVIWFPVLCSVLPVSRFTSPRNSAIKSVSGLSYNSVGVPTCCRRPLSMIPIRVARPIASS